MYMCTVLCVNLLRAVTYTCTCIHVACTLYVYGHVHVCVCVRVVSMCGHMLRVYMLHVYMYHVHVDTCRWVLDCTHSV